MAEKKPVEAATAAPGEKRAVAPPRLAKASESGDPSVQKLLGDRQTAYMNGDKDAEALVNASLAELGFE